MKLAVILSTSIGILALVVASLALVQIAELRRDLSDRAVRTREGDRDGLERELEALRAAIEEAKQRQAEARARRSTEPEPEGDTGPAPERLAQGLADLEQLTLRLDAVEERVEEHQVDPIDIGNQILRGRMPTGETVAEFLDRRLEERALGGRGLDAAETIDKKPSMDELAAVLNLDDGQRLAVRDSLDRAKDQAFQLLATPRHDGGNFVDDMAEIFLTHGEEGEEQMGALLMKMFSEPYPGSTETYGSRIFQIQGEASAAIQETLREDQASVYKGLELDLLEVDTGKNPFEEHIRRAAEARAAEEVPAEEGEER